MSVRIPSIHRTLIALGALALAVFVIPAGTVHAQAGKPTFYQSANLVDFATGAPVAGAATLFRTVTGLEARIATSELDPDAAYTVWWVVWNNPNQCSAPCGEDDLGIPGNSVFYATSFVTGIDGIGNASASLASGRLPNGLDALIPGGLRAGRGLRAEVHLVIRTHGPVIPGSAAEQLSTFEADCDASTCVDQLAAVFPPIH